MSEPRIAVVGHVEWVDFAVVARLPLPGEILEVGARCGARCLTGRGPYGAELPRGG